MNYSKNDILEVNITDIGNEGEGIGKCEDGFTLFVKDAVIGDRVRVKIMKSKKNYAYAHLEEVLSPSADRVIPRCPIARACGGCQLQSMSYSAQLAFKTKKVKNNLIRLGGFDEGFIDSVMQPICAMEEPYRYRDKAQFPFGTDRDGKIVCGFYAGRTHSIIPCTDCELGVTQNKEVLDIILDYMNRYHVSPYNEETATGLIRHVLIRKGFATDELMVCLVVNTTEDLPAQDKLVEALAKLDKMTSVSLSVNTEQTNVIMGTTVKTIYGSETITDRIGDVTFAISPLSFYQVNPVMTEKMYRQALEYASLTGNEVVWDLYCGIGTISLFLAQKASKVYGVEIVPQAIEDAKQNAVNNGISNTEFIVGAAEDIAPSLPRPDVIVVDPPRKGCDERCISTIIENEPKRIVYVSCDSATLARDLRILCDNGYEITSLRAFDNFSQTVHVETVCLLSKLHEAKHHVSVKPDMDEYYEIVDKEASDGE